MLPELLPSAIADIQPSEFFGDGNCRIGLASRDQSRFVNWRFETYLPLIPSTWKTGIGLWKPLKVHSPMGSTSATSSTST